MFNLIQKAYYKLGAKDCYLRSDLISIKEAKELFEKELQRISDEGLIFAPAHHLYHGIKMCDEKIESTERKRQWISSCMDWLENPFGIQKVSR